MPGFIHLSIGQEAIAAGVGSVLGRADTLASTHRGHGHALAKGVALDGFFAEIMGRHTGICRGRGGSMHVADMSVGMLGANGIVGAGIPLATGSAMAHQVRRIARPGRDVTVVTYGATVDLALGAAGDLAGDGVEVEVLDLRSIQPWDEAAVLQSLARTHRLVVLHEAVEAFGVGAEIAARMADVGFDELDGPIVRIGAPFMPVPFAKPLEDAFRPNAERVVAAVRRVLA